ncbi:MBL fold metallo-hydrolase [Solibacillus sp. MA9]|uniref:MBL fold metallo-hydrolase n=1 Tax=Solibacillus palustris TaxID=2908203 RepID=A0ABS9UCS5_9BACL|nr:MBL fold metallo-hydrolase [Solibacillus sp. MA9]MCH7322143.1 MBL fold metallo-hydrolase [Solibacillus sp. MA9]
MKRFYVILLTFLLAACNNEAMSSNTNLTVHAFKVGKADSLLVSHLEEHILIDAAEEDDGEKIVAYLQSQGITKLNALIITHFDKDHVGGADYVVREMDIEHIYVPNYESTSKQTQQFLYAVEEREMTIEKLTSETALSVGAANGKIYPPIQTNFKGDNDLSLVISLLFNDTSFLFTGDAEAPRIAELLADPTIVKPHTFLKVPHHGRFNDQTTALINAVQPTYALITSSNKNPEEPATVAALKKANVQIFTTREGDVEFLSDGTMITVKE